MDAITTYRILHLIGLITLFLGLGGMVLVRRDAEAPRPKLPTILHGLGLLLMLVAGFGLQARLQLGFPGWLIGKIVMWLLIGALPVLVRRGAIPRGAGWLLAIALGVIAIWLGKTKPF